MVTLASFSGGIASAKVTMTCLSVACQPRIFSVETTAETARSTPSSLSSANGLANGLKCRVALPGAEHDLVTVVGLGLGQRGGCGSGDDQILQRREFLVELAPQIVGGKCHF